MVIKVFVVVCSWLFGLTLTPLAHAASGREIVVAAIDSSSSTRAAADWQCSGEHDEENINAAIDQLSQQHSETVEGCEVFALDMKQIDQWQPTQPGMLIEQHADSHQRPRLEITAAAEAGTEYPGVVRESQPLDVSRYDAFQVNLDSPSAIKLRLILRDSQGNAIHFHEKLPEPGSEQRLRFHLNQGYRGEADLKDITTIALQATSELGRVKFSLAQPVFIKQVALEFNRIHPDSLRVSSGDQELERGQDFDIDLERGQLWLLREVSKPAEISYRHGGGTVRLLPGRYSIPEGTGIQLRSYCTLDLSGATLVAADTYAANAQLIQTIPEMSHTDITVIGGKLIGHRMQWDPRVNVGGLVIRDTSNVRVSGMEVVDFNSVGMAVLNTETNQPRELWPRRVAIVDNRIARCATEYVDIRGDLYGAVGKGNEHKAMLRLASVRDFEIRGNRIEDSFGDAKWVVDCQDGLISGNIIENSRMGSYFVERSVRVIGTGNLIRNAGSRAVTIERGSHQNTFSNNIILNSYREGVWLMGCSECIIQANRFENNGWRNSDELDSTIKVEWQAGYAKEKASRNLIAQNIIKTQPHQAQAIWVASGENSRENVITDNIFIGVSQAVRDDGVDTVVAGNQTRP